MVRDLDIPITIIGHPTVREKDGLAMSSRNARLTPAERAKAPRLSETLFQAASEIAQGRPVPETLHAARHALTESGFAPPEYLELRSEKDLRPLDAPSEPARLLAAVFLGKVRLIDNVRLP
jgi:pantoate--beta-alanine ligase